MTTADTPIGVPAVVSVSAENYFSPRNSLALSATVST